MLVTGFTLATDGSGYRCKSCHGRVEFEGQMELGDDDGGSDQSDRGLRRNTVEGAVL